MTTRFRSPRPGGILRVSGLLLLATLVSGGLWQAFKGAAADSGLSATAGCLGGDEAIVPAGVFSRGSILDRSGVVLATNRSTWAVGVKTAALPAEENWLPRFSGILGLDPQVLKRKVLGNEHFVWIKADLTPKELSSLDGVLRDGIEVVQGTRRMYPYGTLAAAVLGFVDRGGRGLEGIEYAYDRRLADRGPPAQAGADHDLALTLEWSLQFAAEKELQTQLSRLDAERGCFVITSAEDGQILAMANSPSWNPGTFWKADPALITNLALKDTVEPTAVLHLANWLAHTRDTLIAQGLPEASSPNTPGLGAPPTATGGTARKWHWETPADSIVFWSPWTREEIQGSEFHPDILPVLWSLGFGQTTGIDLPGEAPGRLPPTLAGSWETVRHQGLKASPLQVLRVFSTLVNGGKIITPHVALGKHAETSPSVWELPLPEGSRGASVLDELVKQSRELLAVGAGPSLASVKWKGRSEGPSPGDRGDAVVLGFWPPTAPKVTYILALEGLSKDPRDRKGTLGRAVNIAQLASNIPLGVSRPQDRTVLAAREKHK